MQIHRVADLSPEELEAVRRLARAVYPPEELANWPGNQIEWTGSDRCLRASDDNGMLTSYVGVHLRDATCDGQPVRIGGIGGVKTHPACRRRGLASKLIQRAVEFFHQQQNVAFALLVCEPDLLSFYSRLGWREFAGQLLVRQHGASCLFTFNRVMTIPIRSGNPTANTIDLCGPPW